MKIKFFYFIFFLFVQSLPVSGQESSFSKIQNYFGRKLDAAQEFASDNIFYATNKMDSFFGDVKSLEYDNGSRLRVYSIFEKREGQNITPELNYRFRIRLPALQEKLHLELFRNDASAEKNTPTDESVLSTDQARATNSPLLGLGYGLDLLKGFETRIGTGVKLSLPPDFYIYFRSKKDITLGDFLLTISPNWIYSFKDNLTTNVFVDLDRNLGDSVLARFSNTYSRNENTRIIYTSHGPSLFHKLSDRRTISYNVRANFSDATKYSIVNYIFQIDLRQKIYKNWVFYDLIPYIDWPKDKDFNREHGIIFKLEFIFGER